MKNGILPQDEYNTRLVSYVHPPNWINPQPAECYDLVVIGAGTAGLVVAAGAAGLDIGLKIALIEKFMMGGDCLNVGCIPSKSIIRCARAAGEIFKAQTLGIKGHKEVEIDFPVVMERMRRIRARISPHDSAQRFQNLGIDVFFAEASFFNQNNVSVDGKTLRYKKAVIATGARARHPSIEGIQEAGFLTNETVFSLSECPNRLGIIGGGAIGCELAQAFARLGAEVFLFHRHSHLLNKEDEDAAQIIQNTFLREGINLILDSQIELVEKTSSGKIIYYLHHGVSAAVTVDEILVAVGRAPNVQGLNLESVGVEYDDKHGVKVNDYLQTTNPRIYAAGDVCLSSKFTHAADGAARIVIKNALFSPFGLGRFQFSSLIIPRCTYTAPEIAHVGMSPSQAQEKGLSIGTITIPLSSIDRAITDGEEEGFVKIHHREKSGEILGATIVASHAGEMISQITTAMVGKMNLNQLSSVIHPYPTQGEGIKKAADAYRRKLLTANVKRLLALLTKLS